MTRLEDAEEPVLADDRRGDDRVEADVPDARVAFRVVVEPLVADVVARRHGPPLGDGEAGQPGREPVGPRAGQLLGNDPVVERRPGGIRPQP